MNAQAKIDCQDVKIWTREDVIALLQNNQRAVVKAIKQLYARQTADEQSTRTTKVSNGRGFNSNDAAFLSDIAKKLPLYNDNMTARQTYVARKKLAKYWRQLLEIIEENGGQVSYGVKQPKREKAIEPSSVIAVPVISDPAKAPVREAVLSISGEWTI